MEKEPQKKSPRNHGDLALTTTSISLDKCYWYCDCLADPQTSW